MTKYVLNSGGISNNAQLKREFHRELVKDLSDSPVFLICSFAEPREDWDVPFKGRCESISEDVSDSRSPRYIMATPGEFVDQCQEADVIYLTGGDDHLLQYWMRRYDLHILFRNKVVATNSASSDMLAQSFWPCDWRTCMNGLGILPIKFLAHFESRFGYDDPRGPVDWQKGLTELKAYGDTSLPVHALREGEFVVFEVDEDNK